MNFKLGKKYIVEVTEKGIIPREEFLEERYIDKDHDDLDFLTDEEKMVIVNEVLYKIRKEIEQNAYPIVHGVNNHEKGMTLYGILQIIDKYRESEDET